MNTRVSHVPVSGGHSLLGRAALTAVMRRHPIMAFFALAYGVSWAMLLVLYGLLGLPAAVVILLQTLGPTVAALVMAGMLDGPAGRRRLLARIRIWRVARRWYAFALVGIPAACILAAIVLPGALIGLGDASVVRPAIEFLVYMAVGFFSGPLFEEPGWRGFALPRMQASMGALRATLVLGALWAAWHLPQYLVPEWADENGGLDPVLIVAFLIMVVAIAPVMTWLFNRTQRQPAARHAGAREHQRGAGGLRRGELGPRSRAARAGFAVGRPDRRDPRPPRLRSVRGPRLSTTSGIVGLGGAPAEGTAVAARGLARARQLRAVKLNVDT